MVESIGARRLADLPLGKTSPFLANLVDRYEGLKALGNGWVQEKSAQIINIEPLNPQQPLDIYNGLFIYLAHLNKLVLIARGDKPGTQHGQVISADARFEKNDVKWVQDGLKIPGEDPTPAPSLLGEDMYLSRTDTTNLKDGSGLVASWRPAINIVNYRDRQWYTKPVAKGEEGQKDLLLGFHKGNTHIVSRYRTGSIEDGITSGFRMGKYLDQDPLHLQNYLKQTSTDRSYDIDDGRPAGEKLSWPGGNQIVFLQNGNIGLLGHDGMYTSDLQRPYITTVREYNKNHQLVVPPFAIATTDDMPPLSQTGTHENDLIHTVFFKQVIAGVDSKGREVSWTLVGGLRDKRLIAVALSRSPFSSPFDKQSNSLFVVPLGVLKAYGLPTTKAA